MSDHIDIDEMFSDTTRLEGLLNDVQTSVDELNAFENTGDGTAGAEIKSSLEILSLPKTVEAIKADFINYSDWIRVFINLFGGEDFNLQAILDCCEKDPSAYLVIVDDEHTTGTGGPFARELTYAIAVKKKFKGIYIIFRGSVNGNDWIANVQVNAVDCLLPGFTNDAERYDVRQRYGRVHEGYYNYLFGETNKGKSKGEKSWMKLKL